MAHTAVENESKGVELSQPTKDDEQAIECAVCLASPQMLKALPQLPSTLTVEGSPGLAGIVLDDPGTCACGFLLAVCLTTGSWLSGPLHDVGSWPTPGGWPVQPHCRVGYDSWLRSTDVLSKVRARTEMVCSVLLISVTSPCTATPASKRTAPLTVREVQW